MKINKKMKFWRMLKRTVIVLVTLFILWIGFHHGMAKYEQKKYEPVGKMVKVDGKNMNVYIKGEGKNTILLMSGLGTVAPVMDFEPLIDELAKNNKVVVVEPFGYGWSDLTKKKRTVENMVEETREALRKSGIKEPLILMPHSISGVYSMYFANEYPNEVKAIIGIDITLPKALEYFDEPAPTLPGFLKFAAPTGLTRMAAYLVPNQLLPIAKEGVYSNKNLSVTKALSSWRAYNSTVIGEAKELSNNINKTKHMSFPESLPVMIFTMDEEKANKDGKNNLTFYQTQLEHVNINKLVTFKGHHYLHWNQSKNMSGEVNEFEQRME